jgi:hypothetical protein
VLRRVLHTKFTGRLKSNMRRWRQSRALAVRRRKEHQDTKQSCRKLPPTGRVNPPLSELFQKRHHEKEEPQSHKDRENNRLDFIENLHETLLKQKNSLVLVRSKAFGCDACCFLFLRRLFPFHFVGWASPWWLLDGFPSASVLRSYCCPPCARCWHCFGGRYD